MTEDMCYMDSEGNPCYERPSTEEADKMFKSKFDEILEGNKALKTDYDNLLETARGLKALNQSYKKEIKFLTVVCIVFMALSLYLLTWMIYNLPK